MLSRLFVAAIALSAAPALSQDGPRGVTIMSVDHLKSACVAERTEKNATKVGLCIGYVRAIFDNMYVDSVASHINRPNTYPDPQKCLPGYVTNDILITIVTDKLKATKNTSAFAYVFVQDTIRAAFPGCLRDMVPPL